MEADNFSSVDCVSYTQMVKLIGMKAAFSFLVDCFVPGWLDPLIQVISDPGTWLMREGWMKARGRSIG